MPPKNYDRTYKLPKAIDNEFDVYIVVPTKVQEKALDEIKNEFDLSDEETNNYYDMIREDNDNPIIKKSITEMREKVTYSNTLNIEYNKE